MSVEITYFVHGTTFDNEQGISSGWKDVDISQKGIDQSILLKDQIKGKIFDVVFCSDLKRAVHSANLTFEGLVSVVRDERLRECNYGDFNGAPSEKVEAMCEQNITQKFPNGESYEDVKKGSATFCSF